MSSCYKGSDLLSEHLYDAQDWHFKKIARGSKKAKTAKIGARGKIPGAAKKAGPKPRSRRRPPAAAGPGQARQQRLSHLSPAPCPGRDAADAGTRAGRPRRHPAAI